MPSLKKHPTHLLLHLFRMKKKYKMKEEWIQSAATSATSFQNSQNSINYNFFSCSHHLSVFHLLFSFFPILRIPNVKIFISFNVIIANHLIAIRKYCPSNEINSFFFLFVVDGIFPAFFQVFCCCLSSFSLRVPCVGFTSLVR